jgi:hypothetical protein
MTKDPKKIREIVRVCITLSKSAATPEERDEFAELANKWQKFATNAEACLPLLDEERDPKKDSRRSVPLEAAGVEFTNGKRPGVRLIR